VLDLYAGFYQLLLKAIARDAEKHAQIRASCCGAWNMAPKRPPEHKLPRRVGTDHPRR